MSRRAMNAGESDVEGPPLLLNSSHILVSARLGNRPKRARMAEDADFCIAAATFTACQRRTER